MKIGTVEFPKSLGIGQEPGLFFGKIYSNYGRRWRNWQTCLPAGRRALYSEHSEIYRRNLERKRKERGFRYERIRVGVAKWQTRRF
ncbi:TPA: hypothetical protein DCZ90_02435 [Candidatus Amesbacteria bacterium]|nr:hypothetical protein [Candidatus Amesbacteria bacterium]